MVSTVQSYLNILLDLFQFISLAIPIANLATTSMVVGTIQFYRGPQKVTGTVYSQTCSALQRNPVKLQSRADKLALSVVCNVSNCWFGKHDST